MWLDKKKMYALNLVKWVVLIKWMNEWRTHAEEIRKCGGISRGIWQRRCGRRTRRGYATSPASPNRRRAGTLPLRRRLTRQWKSIRAFGATWGNPQIRPAVSTSARPATTACSCRNRWRRQGRRIRTRGTSTWLASGICCCRRPLSDTWCSPAEPPTLEDFNPHPTQFIISTGNRNGEEASGIFNSKVNFNGVGIDLMVSFLVTIRLCNRSPPSTYSWNQSSALPIRWKFPNVSPTRYSNSNSNHENSIQILKVWSLDS